MLNHDFTFSGDFIEFQPVTLVPFEPNLMDLDMLSSKHIDWLNSYNQEIIEKVLPKVSDDRTRAWIEARTNSIWNFFAKFHLLTKVKIVY